MIGLIPEYSGKKVLLFKVFSKHTLAALNKTATKAYPHPLVYFLSFFWSQYNSFFTIITFLMVLPLRVGKFFPQNWMGQQIKYLTCVLLSFSVMRREMEPGTSFIYLKNTSHTFEAQCVTAIPETKAQKPPSKSTLYICRSNQVTLTNQEKLNKHYMLLQ